jgi:hypothetical protein
LGAGSGVGFTGHVGGPWATGVLVTGDTAGAAAASPRRSCLRGLAAAFAAASPRRSCFAAVGALTVLAYMSIVLAPAAGAANDAAASEAMARRDRVERYDMGSSLGMDRYGLRGRTARP